MSSNDPGVGLLVTGFGLGFCDLAMKTMTVSSLGSSLTVEDDHVPLFWKSPNKYAGQLKVDGNNEVITFEGYQQFVVTKYKAIPSSSDLSLQKKQELLKPYFQPRYLAKRTVLDIGANAGFFSFWALQSGADRVTAIDIDDDYLKALGKAATQLGFSNLEIAKANFIDWDQSADVVLALALIHWVYSCTALSGSLDRAIEKLSGLTNHMLILEWIDPDDAAIKFFHHLDWNRDLIRAPYNLDEFEAGLARHFALFEMIGETSPTRKLYVAFRSDLETDLSGPLPFLRDKASVIYSRWLGRTNGIDYWSRLYDDGDVVLKQATLSLAEREAHFLSQLTGDYFPRVLSAVSRNGHSELSLERIQGKRLAKVAKEITTDLGKFYDFISHSLNILEKLQRTRIVHRDVSAENILIRNGKPVLIDFGWAISDQYPCITPGGLGDPERPPDGSFCDVYSMGKVFDQLNDHRYRAFDQIIELMTEPDAALRITDIDSLRFLFDLAFRSTATALGIRPENSERSWNGTASTIDFAIDRLLTKISERTLTLELLNAEQSRQRLEIAEKETAFEAVSKELIKAHEERTKHLISNQSLVAQINDCDEVIRVLDKSAASLSEERDQLVASNRVLAEQIKEREDVISSRDERIAALQNEHHELSAQLSNKVGELDRIKRSIGWRLLNRYGKFKYRHLLRVYRMFGL